MSAKSLAPSLSSMRSPGFIQREDGSVVCPNIVSPLSTVAAHKDIDCIERFFAAGFPLHLAVHKVHDAEPLQRDYTELHAHPQPELNVIIPDASGLEYEIQLGEERYRVCEPTSIWVPPHVPHSANVIRGSGYFVAVRLKEEASR
ncbi:hypothetical protein OV208_13850 [Corallococcus sp. bb12-1]|uniref:hypothetical protein n=1 Tax=Corallococcus sp. bb12-1 TaxID=2996784 RepID=UPI00226FE2CD|nr:hypothetical protein [Corallococcus sp. bb12-1]MCY1042402.1 hypothetical protein [Corallococcus sp. bb12-1]